MVVHVRVIVAGVGNVLRGDDGFGVVVAQRLDTERPPPEVKVMDTGIGGIHLVQELLDRTDALIVVDAVDRGRAPGTVFVMRPDVEDVYELPLQERRDFLADMHYATPERALALARGLGVLPESVWIVGCQPADADRLGEGLSEPVAGAVEEAAREVRRLVTELGIAWP
jgi:hydrogenase maturation protease